MKESNYKSYPGLIFREVFNDEQSVMKNGGVVTNATFSDNKVSFDDGHADFQKNLLKNKEQITLRMVASRSDSSAFLSIGQLASSYNRCQLTLWSDNKLYFEVGSANANVSLTPVYDTLVDYVVTVNISSGDVKFYIDGELVSTSSKTMSTNAIDCDFKVNSYLTYTNSGVSYHLAEAYDRELSSSEISNLHGKLWNKKLVTSGSLKGDKARTWSQYSGGTPVITGDIIEFSTTTTGVRNTGYWTAGKTYKVVCKVSAWSGGGTIRLPWDGGSPVPIEISDNGTYEYETTPNGVNVYIYSYAGHTATVEVLYIQEVSPKTLIDFDSTQGSINNRKAGDVTGDNLNEDSSTAWTAWHSTLSYDDKVYNLTQSDAGYGGLGMYRTNSTNFPVGRKYVITFKAKSPTRTDVMAVNNASGYNHEGLVNPNLTTEYQQYIFKGVQTSNTYVQFYIDSLSVSVGEQLILADIRILQTIPEPSITDVDVVKTGNSHSAEFNGSTSLINTNADVIGTKSVTIMTWIKPRGWLDGSYNGVMVTNGTLKFLNYASSFSMSPAPMALSSNGSTFPPSGSDLHLYKFNFVAVTRKSDGIVNYYIGDLNKAPSQSGSSNLNSGTPGAGTTSVVIGNDTTQTKTFDGKIPVVKVVEGILDIDEITQFWSKTRGKIQ